MLARFRRLFTRTRPPIPWPTLEQERAIGTLEMDGLISPAEAHALRAGDQLGACYAEVFAHATDINVNDLVEAEDFIRAGSIEDAVKAIGGLHEALRDFPALYARSAGHARP